MGRFSLVRSAPVPAPTPLPTPAPAPTPAARVETKAKAPARDASLDLRLRLHARLIDELDLAKLDKLDEAELRRQVLGQVTEFARDERMALNTKELEALGASIYDEMVGLGPIEPLLKDDSINDILINGPYQVYVERRGELELTPIRFRDNDHLLRIVNRIVAAVGRRIDESQPDGRRPPARRQPGQRRHPADRHRRLLGLDPEVLQEAADAREAGRVRRHDPAAWPTSSTARCKAGSRR